MPKRIKKFTLLPDTSENVVHILLKYAVLDDVIKVRLKYLAEVNRIDIKAITGAVKNPKLCAILDLSKLTYELNLYLDRYVQFSARLTPEMMEEQMVKQGLMYPF